MHGVLDMAGEAARPRLVSEKPILFSLPLPETGRSILYPRYSRPVKSSFP